MPAAHIVRTTHLSFDDGAPVRAASAIAPFGGGWLVAQDDETFGAWWRDGRVERVRMFPPVQGLDQFSDDEGTKHLKPDLEAACRLAAGAVLLLGSGSLPARMRGVLVQEGDNGPKATVAALDVLYERITEALAVDLSDLNLEGACVVGDRLRWFQRGHGASGVPSSSVDLDLDALLRTVRGEGDPARIPLHDIRRYEFESSTEVALAITDAAALPDGRILVSLAAEDAPDAVQDGEVVGSALALLAGDEVLEVHDLPTGPDGAVFKVEGVAVRQSGGGGLDVLAVVDQDDPDAPSLALELAVDLAGGE